MSGARHGDRLDQGAMLEVVPLTPEQMHAADLVIVDNICRHSIVNDEPVTDEDREKVHTIRQALGLEDYIGYDSNHHAGMRGRKRKVREAGRC